MRTLKLLLFLFGFSHCQAQSPPQLISKTVVTNWSGYPIYPRLTETKEGTTTWKKEFEYLDDIEVSTITYLSDGLKIKGLMAKPQKPGSYPCIIYNRGGNREFGALKLGHGAITLGKIAKEGYVVIASQYRGNGGSEGIEEFGGKDVNDVTILPEILKEVNGADPTRIGLYGWSRGGMMTYIALTRMENIKAAAVGGAPSDAFETIRNRPNMESKVLAELIPDYSRNKEAELKNRSAVQWVDQFPKDVPILMLHGSDDWQVQASHSLRLALEFDRFDIPYRLIIFEGGDHGLSQYKVEVNEQVLNWFERYLKNEEPLPEKNTPDK